MTHYKRALLLATVAMVIYCRCLANQETTDHHSVDKSEASPAKLVVRPSAFVRRVLGSTLIVSCQATGVPMPQVTWFKDGDPIESKESNSVEEDRISLLNSGYLVLREIRFSDAGLYSCQAVNPVGEESAQMELIVSGAESSGCSDGTTDGLDGYEDIQACRGKWIGHVKKARSLCSAGWRVCSPRDAASLRMLSWTDVTYPNGCYAYNAANSFNQCERCHRENMAGIGSQCRRLQKNHPPACLSVGRIDVFPSAVSSRCEYAENVTTGVLCCKKTESKQHGERTSSKRCHPRCLNGGTCVTDNRCQCPTGFKGASCQIAVCSDSCPPNASCVSPGKCTCNPGYLGPKCKKKSVQQHFGLCIRPCLNGGRCQLGKCKCTPPYYGSFCQKDRSHNASRRPNSTE